jgi:hypothetical protein
VTYLPRANEPVEPHTHESRAESWGCPTCIADEAAAGGGGGGGVGPAGPPGPAGPVGPAGPAGAVGPAGPAGADSTVPGPAGPAGADGAVGPAGADGAPGVDGQDGVDGVSISIQGTVPTYADLPADAIEGECYVVEADGLLYDSDGAGFPPQGSGVPWVGPQGIQGVQGIQGAPGLGITYKGTVAAEADLPATATSGDLYVVSTPAPAHGFVWDADTSAWVDAGPVQGPQGVPGEQGIPGIAGPAGADGADGADSTVPGPVGPAGPAGADGKDGADSTVPGPAGPTAVSADAGNTSVLGTDGLIFTPAGTGGGGSYLPLAGGTMTGTITTPTTVQAFKFGTSPYNIFGASGGVAVRSNTTNIVNFTATETVNYVPITTSGTGVGVRFGSGGPSLSKSGTMIAASAPITVAAAPATDPELANKKYVDDKVAAGGSSVTNPVSGSVAGMSIWTGTQAAYDGLTKQATTVYFITG